MNGMFKIVRVAAVIGVCLAGAVEVRGGWEQDFMLRSPDDYSSQFGASVSAA